jgi:uncharacterized protein (UPF0332 family)
VKPECEALARHRLARAREALDEGEHLLVRERAAGAVNRLYYSAFHAARALLAAAELDSARHSGVITLFHTHFVRTGLVGTEHARALSRAFEKRQKGDYGDFASVTLDEARELREEVRFFVDECERVLDTLTREEGGASR